MSERNDILDTERDTWGLSTLKMSVTELQWFMKYACLGFLRILNDPKIFFWKNLRIDSESFNSQKKHVLSDFQDFDIFLLRNLPDLVIFRPKIEFLASTLLVDTSTLDSPPPVTSVGNHTLGEVPLLNAISQTFKRCTNILNTLNILNIPNLLDSIKLKLKRYSDHDFHRSSSCQYWSIFWKSQVSVTHYCM